MVYTPKYWVVSHSIPHEWEHFDPAPQLTEMVPCFEGFVPAQELVF
jgi:hypothetical protein